jgi:hypothetical protein
MNDIYGTYGGVHRYKLGRHGQPHQENINAGIKTKSISSNAPESQGENGFVPGTSMQYSFLKARPFSGTNLKNPATRPIAQAVDRDTKERLQALTRNVADTRQQIRTNASTNSGTSRPKVSSFNETSDYSRLVEPMSTTTTLKWMLIIGALYLVFFRLT